MQGAGFRRCAGGIAPPHARRLVHDVPLQPPSQVSVRAHVVHRLLALLATATTTRAACVRVRVRGRVCACECVGVQGAQCVGVCAGLRGLGLMWGAMTCAGLAAHNLCPLRARRGRPSAVVCMMHMVCVPLYALTNGGGKGSAWGVAGPPPARTCCAALAPPRFVLQPWLVVVGAPPSPLAPPLAPTRTRPRVHPHWPPARAPTLRGHSPWRRGVAGVA